MLTISHTSLRARIVLLFVLIISSFSVIPVHALNKIIYVKQNASGANNGTSWTNAYTSLQSAFSTASSGDEIWVAAGTYKPTTGTDRTISFNLKNGVALYGGFAGTETSRTHRNYETNLTVLSGDIGVQGNNTDNSHHVVKSEYINTSAILDGFTISSGNAENSADFSAGGGLYNFSGSPSVINVIFKNNYAVFGGGMYSRGGEEWEPSNPVLTNVKFVNNSASEGGGMRNEDYSSPVLTNVVFESNAVNRAGGGGMENLRYSHPILTDVTFHKNTAGDLGGGGGMLNLNQSNPILQRVTFTANTANFGGGMLNYESNTKLTDVAFINNSVTGYGGGMVNEGGNPHLTNVTFHGNAALNGSLDTYGGGMSNWGSSPILTNVTFYNNKAVHGGAMINRDSNSSPTLNFVTMSGNTAMAEGGAISNNGSLLITNSILWGNTGGEIYNNSGTAAVTHSIVQGGYAGTGNLNANPLLAALTNNGGYTQTMALGAGSPAIDAGNNANCPARDQRGVTRPQGIRCDRGAYEFMPWYPVVLSSARADPNPTNANSVRFTVVLSKAVTGVNTSAPFNDFALHATGITGAYIAAVSGSGASYTVTVNTGTAGSGTLRLDVVDNDSIRDAANHPLGGTGMGNGNFTLGEVYTVRPQMVISGNAGVAGVTVSYTGGSTFTSTSGDYSFSVPFGWSGTVTPSKGGYIFSPSNRSYSNVLSNQSAQNYTAIPLYTISGNAGVAGVTLRYADGDFKTVISQPNGNYLLIVPNSWGGTVTPSHACYTFDPLEKSYDNVTGNVSAQDYMPSFAGGSGCAEIDVSVGGIHQARFGLQPQGSTRASLPGLNSGPLKIESTNAIPIMGAERAIYKVNNVATSFTEMMGLPGNQLDTIYWLPWYNNKDLDTQLRFANVSDTPATVHVYIGGVEMGSGFILEAGESTRQSFSGVNDGPVQIVSTVPIVAAERVVYKVNGVGTSFSEMMALPNSQLDTTYWLPWYNNRELDTQLRFANVNDTPASVRIFIGGVEMEGSPFSLPANASTRVSFAGINNGPVKIESDIPILAAERVVYKVNGVNTSFTELMALPNSQLDTIYWLPWYNNAELDTQLRIANATDQPATVHVYIGGVEMGTGFTLQPNESTRQSFTGVNNGPVEIVSDQPIVAAERVIYKVNNIPTSFSEMMGLPNSQLDFTYWLPWYNNVDLDTQLRFGIP